MANPVRPEEIIDIQGLLKAFSDLKTANKDFGTESAAMLELIGKRTEEYKNQLRQLLATIKGVNPQNGLSDQAKDFRDIESALKSVNSAQKALNDTNQIAAKSIKELEAEKKSYIKALKELKSEQNQDTESIKKLESAIKSTSAQMNTLSENYKKATKEIKTAKGSYQELQRSLSENVAKLKSMGGSYDTLTGKVTTDTKAHKELIATIKRENDALKEIDKQMGFNQRNVGNYSSAMSYLVGGVRGAIGSFGTWGIAILAVAEAMQRLNSLVQVGEALRRSQIGVENVSSSSVEASVNLEFLRSVADKLGLEIENLNKDFKTFAGATEGTALEGAKTREMFEGITTAVAAMQLTTDDASGAIRAFSQMISKGTLQAEELKGQLAERLPSAMRITAKTLGVTTEKMLEMMKNGELLAQDVLPKVAEEFNKVYGKDAQKNLETLTGQQNRLTNAWKELLNSETSPLRKFLVFFYDKVTGVLSAISRMGGNGVVSDFNKGRADFTQLYSQSDTKGRELLLKQQYDRLHKLEKDALSETNSIQKAARWQGVRNQMEYIKSLTSIDEKELQLKKDSEAKKLEAQKEANEKAAKEQEKADNKALIAARKRYQVELRELQANEKGTLAQLEISNVNGLISEEQFASDKLKIETQFTLEREKLAMSYFNKYSAMQEELKDDFARIESEKQQNLLNNLKANQQILQEYYKGIKEGLLESYKDLRKGLEDEINKAEIINSDKANIGRISLTKEEIKANYGNRPITESDKMGFRSRAMLLDIQEIKDNLVAVERIYNEFSDRRLQILNQDIQKVKSLGLNETEEKKKIADLVSEYEKEKQDSAYRYQTEITNKKKRLATEEADHELLEFERVFQAKKDKMNKTLENYEAFLSVTATIEENISNLMNSYSDQRISRLEKQKEYELSLAGDNKEAQLVIEKEYQKKINDEKRKQDKREKLSTIFKIILNNQVAKVKALAEGNLLQLILAQITGTIALATAIATPLPEYAKGKKKGDQYEGLAVVGEKGAEIVEKDGKASLFSEPTVTYVDPKTRVYTATETSSILGNRNLGDSNISNEQYYNKAYLKKTNRYEQQRQINSTFEFQRLRRTLSSGIDEGFEKATIVINNSDGSNKTYRRGDVTQNITNRTIFR